MKLIKIHTILGQAFCFFLISLFVDLMLSLSPIQESIPEVQKAIENVVESIQKVGLLPMLHSIVIIFLECIKNGNGTFFIVLAAPAFLWGIFYERCHQYHSLATIPTPWVTFLFTVSSILVLQSLVLGYGFLAGFYSPFMSTKMTTHFILMLPVIMTKCLILLMPLFVTVRSSQALYSIFFKKTVTL